MDHARIMVVEDEFVIASDMMAMLQSMGHTVHPPVARGEEVLPVARAFRPDLILMDVMLGGAMNGLKAAEKVYNELGISVVFITAFADQATIEGAKSSRPYGYLIKPFGFNDLRAAVEMALVRTDKDRRILRRTASYRWVVDNIAHGVYVLDQDFHCLLANRPGAETLGVRREDLLGQDIRRVVPGLESSETFQAYQQVMHQRRPATTVEQYEHPDGGRGWREITISPVDEGIICVSQDITARMEADARRQRDHDLLEERVAERTAELVDANRALEEEIAERRAAEEALRESEDRYRQIFETNQAVKLVIDPQTGDIVDANQAACDFYGYPRAKLLSLNIGDINQMGRQEIKTILDDVVKKPRAFLRLHDRLSSGEIRDVEVYTGPIKTGGRDLIYSIVHDVTERTRAEAALRRSEETSRALLDANREAALLVDRGLRTIAANHQALSCLHTTAERLLGGNLGEFLSPPLTKQLIDTCEAIFKGGQPIYFEDTVNGRILARHFFPVKNPLGEVERLAIFSRDITERRRAEEKLHRYRDQLRSLASALSLAEERERRTIAGELHDRVGQTLALAEIMLSRARANTGDEGLAESLSQVQDLIQQSAADTRTLTIEISPPALHQLGLAAAVDELAEHLQKIHGTPIQVIEDLGPMELGSDTNAALYRCARELMINALKHAEADRITVTISSAGEDLSIAVADDGKGFDPALLASGSATDGHFGLLSIRERMDLLGGGAEVTSRPGKGSRVRIWMPMPGPNAAKGGAAQA